MNPSEGQTSELITSGVITITCVIEFNDELKRNVVIKVFTQSHM